jgi:sulfide dehydrogenase cytochrome subunit
MAKWVPAFAGTAVYFFVAIAALAAEMPPGASSCSGCHAAGAAVQTPVPPLAGRPADDTVAAVQAFRAGARPATVMDRIAKGFSDDEIAAIAAWYAAQKLEPKKKSGGG